MDVSHWHGPGARKTLIVLGAGASRGAALHTTPGQPRPPLDVGFFSELQRLTARPEVWNLLDFIRSEYGSSLSLSMEEFFSEAEYTDRFHKELSIDPGPRLRRYQRALEWFYAVLPALFKEAIGEQTCDLHGKLARQLYTNDVVLSFNYDCLIDAALRDHAGGRWDPGRGGYGFSPKAGSDNWHTTTKGRTPAGTIMCLKPHGSLNWELDAKGSVTLNNNPYDIGSAEGRIIPPTWFKRLNEEPFASVWKEARRQIRTCRVLIVVGYSVPQTDLFSRALFKAEVGSKEKREKLDMIILANPDRVARQRFVDLVSGGMEYRTRIVEFDGYEELAQSITTS